MVIIELIGSISLAIVFVIVVTLAILHIKNKRNDQDRNNSEQFKNQKNISVVNVIENDEVLSSPITYGIQWTIPSLKEETSPELISSLSDHLLKTLEFEQGDSLSVSEQTISVRDLIEKFENNVKGTFFPKEKNQLTDSDLTSIDTNFDNQTIKTDLNQNQQKFSHHSSISNFDVTIPSNLSSSIDLEQFECISTTSNLSEFLNTN